LELFLSKKRILEIYLNVIEWGPGIYGAEAAAQKYYHISAEHLNATQAAALAVIIPNPRKIKLYSPYTSKRKVLIRKWSNDVDLENEQNRAVKKENEKSKKRKTKNENN